MLNRVLAINYHRANVGTYPAAIRCVTMVIHPHRDRSWARAPQLATRLALLPLLLLLGCGDAPAPPPHNTPVIIDGGTVVVMDEAG